MENILKCECGNYPIYKEVPSGQGEFSFVINCENCKKGVVYTLYDKGYDKAAIREWNNFTRLNNNPLHLLCDLLFKEGKGYSKNESISILIEKLNIDEKEAEFYYEKYVDFKVFFLNCQFFKYRYTGMYATEYISIIEEEMGLSNDVINQYHNVWLLNMEETNGRYLEEGVDYRKNKSPEKRKIFTIFERDPNKK